MLRIIFYTLLTLNLVRADYKFETKWFRVPLDHFGFQRNETFEIKYLENEDNWDQGGGPIFFYTGNEVSFANTVMFLVRSRCLYFFARFSKTFPNFVMNIDY